MASSLAVPSWVARAGELADHAPGAGHGATFPLGNSIDAVSQSANQIRGLMVDAARVPEKLEYYQRLIDFCAEWKFNTLQFRLTDDQGSALRFASAPGLVTHTNAFTPEQLRGLAEYGQRRGVDLIPEIESFGHTEYITRSPDYAHLSDRDPSGSREFSGVSPVDPAVLALMKKLYAEVAGIFPSKYLHGGCDEVNWGGSALSRQALASRSRAQLWADYLNSLNGIAAEQHKELIVWGDFVLHKEPQILGLLDKRIIIMDWEYSETNANPLRQTLEKVAAHGARAIGAPALSCYRWGPRVGSDQLRNVDAFTDAYLNSTPASSLGVMVTNWVPSRYVQNSIWDYFAYSSVALNEGSTTARSTGFKRFVETHYRANWNEHWSEVFDSLYSSAPRWAGGSTRPSQKITLHVPWSSDAELISVLKSGALSQNPFTRLSSLLISLESSVRANLTDFHSLALTVRYMETMFWRERAVAELIMRQPLDKAKATSAIQSIATRDKALEEALVRDWNTGRFADAPAASEPVVELESKDQMLFQWKRAASYSALLAQNPDRFFTLLGSFPEKS